jgi:hypothetical protein
VLGEDPLRRRNRACCLGRARPASVGLQVSAGMRLLGEGCGVAVRAMHVHVHVHVRVHVVCTCTCMFMHMPCACTCHVHAHAHARAHPNPNPSPTPAGSCLCGHARAQPAAVDHLGRELGELWVRSELEVEEEGAHPLRDEPTEEREREAARLVRVSARVRARARARVRARARARARVRARARAREAARLGLSRLHGWRQLAVVARQHDALAAAGDDGHEGS